MLEARTNLRLRRWVVFFVGSVGLVYFLIRGPIRAFQPGGSADFQFVHNAQKTFDAGGNPYLREDMLDQARDSPLHGFLRHYLNGTLLYTPGFLFVFYPMGLVAVESAGSIWIALQLAAFGALVYLGARLVGLDQSGRLLLLVAALFLAPVHTSISHGQPGIFFCVLTVGLFCYLKQHREVAAALALGFLMIKPSFGAPAAWIALVRGGWRVPALGAVVALITWLPFLSRYGVVDGSQYYLTAIRDVQNPGGDADDSRRNPLRFDLINLRSWLHSWNGPRLLTEGLNGLLLLLMVWALYRFRGSIEHESGAPYYWTLASVFVCLAVYHRFYDATVLIVAVAAAIKLWGIHRGAALTLGLLLLPFAAPGTAYLHQELDPGGTSEFWFEALVIRHQPALILLGGLLSVFMLSRISRRGPEAEDPNQRY
jgi:hypothetical protein